MGNNNIKPARYATVAYTKFLEPLSPDNKTTNNLQFVRHADHEFNLFLEDFLVNDDDFQTLKKTPEDARTCLGTLLLTHAAFQCALKERKLGWSTTSFCEEWHEGTPCDKVVKDLVSLDYIYAKGQFYRWNDSRWTPCEESEVVVVDPRPNFEVTIEPCDFTSTEVDDARRWAQEKLNECKEALDNLKVSDIVKVVKDRDTVSNAVKDKLPCYSRTVSLCKSATNANKKKHFFTVRLPYDPCQDTTKVVEKFVSSFDCTSKDLANNLTRWGCRDKRTMTVIVGPASSGKSTLCQVAQALYGPFATSSTVDNAGSVDYDLVRTCFFDENKVLDEDSVAAHDCHNLVCTSLEIPSFDESYGGREVFTLVLGSPIDSAKASVDTVSKITTSKQLGSLLGWCLKNNQNPLGSLSSNFEQLLMSMLRSASKSGPGGGCGDADCKNCGKDSPKESTEQKPTALPKESTEQKPTALPKESTKTTDSPKECTAEIDSDDEPSPSTKIFRVGANGISQVPK